MCVYIFVQSNLHVFTCLPYELSFTNPNPYLVHHRCHPEYTPNPYNILFLPFPAIAAPFSTLGLNPMNPDKGHSQSLLMMVSYLVVVGSAVATASHHAVVVSLPPPCLPSPTFSA